MQSIKARRFFGGAGFLALALTSLDEEGVPAGIGNLHGQDCLHGSAAVITRRAIDAVVFIPIRAVIFAAVFLVRPGEHSEPGVITGPGHVRVEATRGGTGTMGGELGLRSRSSQRPRTRTCKCFRFTRGKDKAKRGTVTSDRSLGMDP